MSTIGWLSVYWQYCKHQYLGWYVTSVMGCIEVMDNASFLYMAATSFTIARNGDFLDCTAARPKKIVSFSSWMRPGMFTLQLALTICHHRLLLSLIAYQCIITSAIILNSGLAVICNFEHLLHLILPCNGTLVMLICGFDA